MLNQAEQAAVDAKGTADEVQNEADAARAKAATAATCPQSFLSSGGVFSGPTLSEGVEATVTELQALQPQCATALDQSSSGPSARAPAAGPATISCHRYEAAGPGARLRSARPPSQRKETHHGRTE